MTTFCKQRLSTLGITPEINQIKRPDLPDYDQWFFQEDEHDNIRINYYDLRAYPYKFDKKGNKWPVDFYRTRLKVPVGDMKYVQPKGSPVLPFLTPIVISRYMNGKTYDTLFFTEGEFKAFAGAMAGLPIIGFPSIQGAYDNDVHKSLHPDILKIIDKAQVKKLVFITDADTFTVNYAPDKDLCKRASSFYTAVRNFYEAAALLQENHEIGLQHAYWCHIKTSFCHTAKGLDDLLMAYPAKRATITNELLNQQFYEIFDGYHLTEARMKSLKKTFGITTAQDFYQIYKPFIGSKEFRYRSSRYQWDGDQLQRLRHDDADKYFRIGADWYKIIQIPTAKGDKIETMISYKKSEITGDYARKYPDFLEQCARYDWFCNVPSINGTYKRVIDNCYNVFMPMLHTPTEGSIENSLMFLKHLFDNKDQVRTYQWCDVETKQEHQHTLFCGELGDQFTVALDWLSVMVQHPTQNLPVPCLVSKKEGTGKTTFLNWLVEIFGKGNATILDNERFKMSFNSHYATKFMIGIDEGFLEVEKKAEKERLKQLVTGNRIFLENKGSDVKEIDFFGKLIICSNDADRLMKIDEDDSRWFVVNVPQFSEENPFLLDKLKEEIPAFLYLIYYRDILHPHDSRLWFKKEWFITEQLRNIIETTKPKLEKAVEETIKDMFLTYQFAELKLDLKWLQKEINASSKYRYETSDIRDYLKKKKNMLPQAPKHIDIPIGFEPAGGGEMVISYFRTKARYYHFKIEEWLNAEEMQEAAKAKEESNEKPDKDDINDAPF